MESEFNGAELRLARIFNGLALEEVAGQVNKTRQYLHKLETGQDAPTAALLQQLAEVLKVEPSFLTQQHSQMLDEDQFHFRKLLTTKTMLKQVVMARGELVARLVGYLDQVLKLPAVNLPQVPDVETLEDIEQAAELCRREWGIGLGPIGNMNRLAEHAGVIVTSFQTVSTEIDALSVALQRPVIVRNQAKQSVGRQRFDVAHELGHFVLHAGVVTGDRLTESQANRFASALLLPRSMMAKHFPKPRGSRLDWQGLREFKLTWKVSKAAILYRARQLDLIDEPQYKSGVITLKRTGEANGEKEDHLLPPEVPELLARALTVLAERKNVYADDIAHTLHVMPELLRDVLGFDPPQRASDSPAPVKRPHLYLVT
jgi:Zn-dependent peptidase ImmA (M78 family)/transcriptional regulator with XRE-family HTH domain